MKSQALAVHYCDANISLGLGGGVTGGLIWDWDYGFRPYLGFGVVLPPPGSASVTCSFDEVSPGWYVAVQGAYGIAVQGGKGPLNSASGGDYYLEGGIGTPGVNVTVFDVFEGWTYRDVVKFVNDIKFPWE